MGEEEALEIQKDAWNTVQMNQETIQVRYCTKGSLDRNLWSEIVEEIKPDFIHLNSMFSKEHALMPLRVARNCSAIQVVLAPRGMLGNAALAIKPLKKRVFLSFARMLDLFKGVIWHASTVSEATEIRMHFRTANVCVAQNLPASLPAHNPIRPSDRWKIVVVGRIHRVKNLDFGLKALLNVASTRPIEVDFIGPVEDANYQVELESMAATQNEVTVRFLGGMPPSELPQWFQSAHYLLSSTTQENFGHSIVEAWAHGCPVLISDRTPWLQLVEKGIGWDWPLEDAVWERGLKKAFSLDASRWAEMSELSREFFNTNVRSAAAEKANLELFQS